MVKDKTDNSLAVLSNNHVLANIDQCSVGDDILQPGAADGGQRIGDTVADLTRWVPLRGGGTKRVDCAIAKIRNEADARQDILGIGYCYGVGAAFIDEKIWKNGRTTERTRGTVIATDAVVEVGYGPNLGITVHDCIISTIESAPGDSGSALLEFPSNRIVGLLFAGNGQVTIGCKARTAFSLLNIETTDPPEIQRSMWLDISRWQGNVDFSVMKARNARGIITKICQGGSMQDDKFAEYYTAAKKVGLLVGGYTFVDPDDGGASLPTYRAMALPTQARTCSGGKHACSTGTSSIRRCRLGEEWLRTPSYGWCLRTAHCFHAPPRTTPRYARHARTAPTICRC